jgi:hypothetical protein
LVISVDGIEDAAGGVDWQKSTGKCNIEKRRKFNFPISLPRLVIPIVP